MMTWHAEKTSRICRERIGGGSFLESALISQGVTGSHSGMTAEGDNSVLMQKVVKDLLTHSRKGKHKMPKIKKEVLRQISQMSDVSNFNSMKILMYAKEQKELKSISVKLKFLVLEQQKQFFDVWMYELNDDIQSLAHAFGERFFLQNAYMALEEECVHQGARSILEKTIYLHMISYLNENMSWYLEHGLISREAAKDLASKQNEAVKRFAPHMNDVLEAFGLI